MIKEQEQAVPIPMPSSNMVEFCTMIPRVQQIKKKEQQENQPPEYECKKQYMFTNDMMFGIELNQPYWDSNYLYINANAVIDPMSPLAKFIDEGIVVQPEDFDLNIRKPRTRKSIELENEKEPRTRTIELENEKEPRKYARIPGRYYKYRFFRKLVDYRTNKKGRFVSPEKINENDCLNFSEFFTMRQNRHCELPYNYNASVLQSKDNGRQFGVSEQENISLLSTIPSETSDDNAVPFPGESYAIVRKDINVKNKSMYHIGFCIYRHNNVNITLEAIADMGHEYLPKFNLYDTNPEGFTFHKRHTPYYNNSKTIVLQGRNMFDIENEIEQEIRPKSKKQRINGGKRKSKRKTHRRRSIVSRKYKAKRT